MCGSPRAPDHKAILRRSRPLPRDAEPCGRRCLDYIAPFEPLQLPLNFLLLRLDDRFGEFVVLRLLAYLSWMRTIEVAR
jgi:hypothetical protein